jgi:RND superfamily putative drug exporter
MVQTIRVVLELPEEASALDRKGWEATRRLAVFLAHDPRVAEVRSLRDFAPARGDDLAFIGLLPAFLKRAYLSGEGEAALVDVIPAEGVEAAELIRFVRELRALDPASLTGLPGARLRVGGLPAFNADYEDALAGHLGQVVALVLLGTLVALFAAFRSLLVPAKAIALNLLSVAAACGAVVLVFQEGHGAAALGVAGPTGGLFPAVPVLVFGIVFGLSMDYEVFLVSRLLEALRAGMGDGQALAEALARTGGVITSAAAIMVAVFGAFALGDFLLVKMLGFALAVAVLVDALVLRVAVGPALLRVAGQWNWWPGRPGEPTAADDGRVRTCRSCPGPSASDPCA